MRWFQDYARERYDVAGFDYDFMRCPGYFKRGEEEANVPVMTDFIRQTRAMLDEVGERKGGALGLTVRVPNTIRGARMLGMDMVYWYPNGPWRQPPGFVART